MNLELCTCWILEECKTIQCTLNLVACDFALTKMFKTAILPLLLGHVRTK